jgi:glycosyltransferase involved in cell wall biosynthesis
VPPGSAHFDVAVVIPVFNKAPHVERAVRSALDQIHPPREVIVVDDNSTDESYEIVRSIGDARIKLLQRSAPGPGGYAARNLAVEHASAEWIAFLDADDAWLPAHLASFAEAATIAGEEIGGIFSAYDTISAEGRQRWSFPAAHASTVSFASLLKAWVDGRRCPISADSCAFRRSLLIDAGLFPAGLARRGGDKDMWIRAAARCRLGYSARSTAEWYLEAVNRVSRVTPHDELPIILRSIMSLLPTAKPEERPLLRRLANLEILMYARYQAGAGRAVPPHFFQQLYWPEGLTIASAMVGYSLIGSALGVPARLRR